MFDKKNRSSIAFKMLNQKMSTSAIYYLGVAPRIPTLRTLILSSLSNIHENFITVCLLSIDFIMNKISTKNDILIGLNFRLFYKLFLFELLKIIIFFKCWLLSDFYLNIGLWTSNRTVKVFLCERNDKMATFRLVVPLTISDILMQASSTQHIVVNQREVKIYTLIG